MGRVEWEDGQCYHEYLQGPCQEGEQLVRSSSLAPPSCQPHGCSQGRVRWEDGLCYEVQQRQGGCSVMYELAKQQAFDISNEKELPELLILQCQDIVPFSSIFNNCIAEARNGTCLKQRRKLNQRMPGDLREMLLRQFRALQALESPRGQG